MISPVVSTTLPVARHQSLINLGVLIALHAPLALLMNAMPLVATIHALITLAIGLWLAVSSREPWKICCAAGYIIGAEVLWRMTGANVFWEIGKYATIAIFCIALVRIKSWKSVTLPVLYFLLLTISIPLTLISLSPSDARGQISFNLSGPLCLAVCVMFFSQIKLSWEERENLTWVIAAPILSIATLCFYGTATTQQINFTDESNFVTSGGFGPNQVSAILGMGALFLILFAVQTTKRRSRWMAFLLGMGLIVLSGLTFSRGGLYNLAAALFVSSLFFLQNPRLRATFFSILFIMVMIGGYFIYPRLNEFTGGMLETRFSDTDPTNRVEIIRSELKVWEGNPILGVGPGMGKYLTTMDLNMSVAAHTEYTRMLAEHGIPGLFAILLLIIMAIRGIRNVPPGMAQAWTAAMIIWPMVEMTHAAMRIAAIGFIFGLGFAGWKVNNHNLT